MVRMDLVRYVQKEMVFTTVGVAVFTWWCGGWCYAIMGSAVGRGFDGVELETELHVQKLVGHWIEPSSE